MERLEFTIIEEGIPPLRRDPLRRLLRVIDQLCTMSSAQYRPERELGLSSDTATLRQLASVVQSTWNRLHVPVPLNSTEKTLLMELLNHRNVTVTDCWLCTPKGKFRLSKENSDAFQVS
jgi:hypothetical protein